MDSARRMEGEATISSEDGRECVRGTDFRKSFEMIEFQKIMYCMFLQHQFQWQCTQHHWKRFLWEAKSAYIWSRSLQFLTSALWVKLSQITSWWCKASQEVRLPYPYAIFFAVIGFQWTHESLAHCSKFCVECRGSLTMVTWLLLAMSMCVTWSCHVHVTHIVVVVVRNSLGMSLGFSSTMN